MGRRGRKEWLRRLFPFVLDAFGSDLRSARRVTSPTSLITCDASSRAILMSASFTCCSLLEHYLQLHVEVSFWDVART